MQGRCEKRGREGGRKREKKGNIMQHSANFHNQKNAEAGAHKYRVGTGIKGYGKWEV